MTLAATVSTATKAMDLRYRFWRAHVEEAGAGMSACWLDFDTMGNRTFMPRACGCGGHARFWTIAFSRSGTGKIRALYGDTWQANTLYRNLGNGQFQNVAMQAGVEMAVGRGPPMLGL